MGPFEITATELPERTKQVDQPNLIRVCKNVFDLFAKPKADYCAKSCGLCYDTCADKSASCKNWKANGFCENALYDSIKKDYCSATCGLC
ncbi:unnamed protein product, partial [Mesorhabditis spiculigera]